MKELNVAVVGATGIVGQEFIKVLEQRRFPMKSIRLLASERSAGKKIKVNGHSIEVHETTPDSFNNIDVALFSAGSEHSRHFSPIASKAGAVVVDNSAAFRMEPGVPLVVPEINPEDIKEHKGIIANPNCSTIQMVMALNPLHKANPIKRVIASTYQAASGIGSGGPEELAAQTKQYCNGKDKFCPSIFPRQISFNLFPQIDVFLDNDYTKEEWKMVEETQKIMHAPDMAISATCVRVPVFVGHSEAVWIEFAEPMSPEEARDILKQAPGIVVDDDPKNGKYPAPLPSAGTDDVFVGRIRKDSSHPNGLVLWIVADNLRKGAALNTVQIAETMIERGWI
ncbi:MAG: aspartate-semialdehyde dehydrogenase [Chloroflexota bacterium]|nr:aspartate-semialdehyde dehydrogenase [Chloroflexota bacterium]